MLCERKKAECYQFSHLPLELLSEHSFTKRGEQIELALTWMAGIYNVSLKNTSALFSPAMDVMSSASSGQQSRILQEL